MKHIPLYKVNDILEVLIDYPWSAHFPKGSLIRVSKLTRVFSDKAHYSAHIVGTKHTWSINDSREGTYLRKIFGENDIDYYLKNE